MNDTINIRKSYCLSKTISELLSIDEHICFTSKSILFLDIDEMGFLRTNIDKNIIDRCNEMNIKLDRKLISINELSNLLGNNLVIGHLDTGLLKYNKVYDMGKNTMHYVGITGIENKRNIEIIDYFIPTLEPSTYKGVVILNSDILNVYTVDKLININYLDIKDNIIDSISNHQKVFFETKKYINMIDKNLTQDNAMDYNINFVTSGYLSTRIMFYINVSQCFEINQQFKDKLEMILNNIIKLEFKSRIIFTKLHFRFTKELKIELIKTFEEIFKNELIFIKRINEVINYEFI